jgi:hypothetical protein
VTGQQFGGGQVGEFLPGASMVALAGAAAARWGLADVFSAALAVGGLCGGLGSLLGAINRTLDGRQARRHKEEVHRAELAQPR